MHELSLVEELVQECTRRAEGRRVTKVRARCTAVVDVEEVLEAFGPMTSGTAMEDAALVVEREPLELACTCGFEGQVDDAQVAGHMVVCPACAKVNEAPAGFELLSVDLN